jgi:hypothetical protein
MTDTMTVRRRLEHVLGILETTEDHTDSPADSQALLRAMGLLEQTFEDLENLELEQERGDP